MIFHLAIPARSLVESFAFYKKLGARHGRATEQAIVMDFHGHQVVLHKTDYIDQNPQMYPRHFGFIYEKLEDVEQLYKRWGGTRFIFRPLFVRNKSQIAEHHTFFLKDPSNNLIEFKWYKNRNGLF